MAESKDIIVEFSGWAKVSPEKIFFVNTDDCEKDRISGVEWQKLSEEKQSNHILESLSDALEESIDSAYEICDALVFEH